MRPGCGAPAGPRVSAPATIDNDGWTRSVHHLLRPERALPESTRGHFAGRHRSARGSQADARWGSGCTFADYDRDGGSICSSRTTCASTSRPPAEPGAGPELPVEGHCRSIAARRGCRPTRTCSTAIAATGRSRTSRRRPASPTCQRRYPMTALAADLDGDGWTDIYVASRLDGRDPLPQQPRRHVHRRRARKRRRLRRGRQRPGRNGRRASATSMATAGSTC